MAAALSRQGVPKTRDPEEEARCRTTFYVEERERMAYPSEARLSGEGLWLVKGAAVRFHSLLDARLKGLV